MILLDGHSLNASKIIGDEALRLSLKERDSTADWTPDNTGGLSVKSWVRGRGGPGDGIVWRVQGIEQDYGEDTPTVRLEHIIGTLRDTILFGEITPEMMGGTGGQCTARQAVEYILARSSDWTLGTFSYSVSNPYKFDGDTLFDALEKVTESLDDAQWTYDLTVYPFRINITAKPDDVACELRADRNLTSLRKTIDRTGMYTRFYPIGKDNLHIAGEYVSKNESTYGTVSKVEVDQSRETEAELIAWANERLAKHAEPRVTVSADGLELADSTGVGLDRMKLGKICRIALPEFGTVMEERIVELEYPDAVNEPEVVRITMANEQEDIARIIANEIKNGAGPSGGGGRGAARQAEEDHAWFEDTDDHVAMVAEGIVGVDPETGEPDWARLSEIVVSGEGIDERVTVMHDDIIEAQAAITINENEIRSEVLRANSEEGMLRSEIVQTANMIRSEVRNALSGFYTEIIQTASSIVIRTGDDTETYHQPTAPEGTPDHPLVDGDVWFNAEGQSTWGAAEGNSWLADSSFDWGQLVQSDIYRYDGTTGQWVQIQNGQAVMQDTRFEQNNEHIQMVAGRVDVVNGRVESYRADFEVKADQITASVREQVNGLGSEIRQTAREIRSEVYAEGSQLYSEIVQTATMIYSHVADEISGMHSEIIQTASMIRASVSASNSQLYSTITQTASQIRMEVRNTNSNIYAKIEQNADDITLKVSKNGVISSINQTSESITISARKIDLDGYVTISQLNNVNGRIDNLMSGNAVATTLLATTLRASVLYAEGTRATWKLANIPGYGYINYLGA